MKCSSLHCSNDATWENTMVPQCRGGFKTFVYCTRCKDLIRRSPGLDNGNWWPLERRTIKAKESE